VISKSCEKRLLYLDHLVRAPGVMPYVSYRTVVETVTYHVRVWHFSDMPGFPNCVSFREESGSWI
jgi:hypothetical protein